MATLPPLQRTAAPRSMSLTATSSPLALCRISTAVPYAPCPSSRIYGCIAGRRGSRRWKGAGRRASAQRVAAAAAAAAVAADQGLRRPSSACSSGCERDRLRLRAYAALQGSNAGRPPLLWPALGAQRTPSHPLILVAAVDTLRRALRLYLRHTAGLARLGFACEGLIDEDVL